MPLTATTTAAAACDVQYAQSSSKRLSFGLDLPAVFFSPSRYLEQLLMTFRESFGSVLRVD